MENSHTPQPTGIPSIDKRMASVAEIFGHASPFTEPQLAILRPAYDFLYTIATEVNDLIDADAFTPDLAKTIMQISQLIASIRQSNELFDVLHNLDKDGFPIIEKAKSICTAMEYWMLLNSDDFKAHGKLPKKFEDRWDGYIEQFEKHKTLPDNEKDAMIFYHLAFAED